MLPAVPGVGLPTRPAAAFKPPPALSLHLSDRCDPRKTKRTENIGTAGDDFAQPVPVKSSTAAVPEDKPVPQTEASTRMPPWAKPYKAKPNESSDGGDRATAGQQSVPSLGSGMPKWGQKANVPPVKEPKTSRSAMSVKQSGLSWGEKSRLLWRGVNA